MTGIPDRTGSVFGARYADAYDLIYRDKDYDAECALIEKLFLEYASGVVHSVLDLGCGTGGHGIALAGRGFQVTGVDRSMDMLAIAQHKAEKGGLPLRLHQADLRDFELGKIFDAALMMFAVLGYQTENDDVIRAFKAARRHLRPGGLLVFDVWYGPAVLAERPGQRFRVMHDSGRMVLRTSTGLLDSLRQRCSVQFQMWEISPNGGVKETAEEHLMRFFFPQELDLFLSVSGFRLRRLVGFPDVDCDPDESTWNVAAIAQAV